MFVRIIVTLALLALHRATPASSADGDGRIDSSEWTSNSSPSSSPPPSESGLHSPSASWPDFVQGLPASQAIGIPVEESIASASAKDGIRGSHASGQPFQGSLDRAPTDPGPSSPPGLHVDFPPGHEAPVVDRHFAGVIAISTYHGSTTPVPRTVLEDPGVRSRLLAYTHWFIEHPEYEFLHHPDAMQGLANHQHAFSYMYRPLTPKEFGYIFPRANVDWAQVIPVMVLRMRLPQRFPWQYGKLEIAGVEMIQPTQYLQMAVSIHLDRHQQVKMRLFQIAASVAFSVALGAVARPQPVLPSIFDTSSSSAQRSSMVDRSRPPAQAPASLQAPSAPTQRASSSINLQAPYQDAPLHGDTVTPHPFLTELPVVRTDVVNTILSDDFDVRSHFPLRQLLSPVERKALHDLAEHHLATPETTWLHDVVDEPQYNLRYRKELYVAAPIPQYDWRKAVGLQERVETEHWLPIIFYKVEVEPGKRTHFNLAGIEVVREVDEAMRVLVDMERRETLKNIAKRLDMIIGHD